MLDDHRQCAQDGGKGTGGLDGAAHLQPPRQHIAGNDHCRQHDGQERMGVLEQVEPELPAQHLLVVGIDPGEDGLQRRHFAHFAVVKGNRLGVFAHPHQAKAEVRLALQLAKVQTNQPLAKRQSGEQGSEHRIADQEQHQPPRDRPQHGGKGGQLQHRAQHDH